ncbi:MAG: LacI family DNA-binding transcriptional regulator [Acetivibrionales bacterium]|jgi:DNA-binding LacI/PurR family transcriptional regulator
MRVTMKDVARVANVSHTTVSNVLNNVGYASEETRRKVLDAVELLNYEQNFLARSMKTNKSQVIGVVISDNSNPLFSLIVKGIEDVAASKGYNVILCNTDQDVEREAAQVKILNERQVDGIIISVASENVSHLDKLIKTQRPVVFINRSPDRVYGDMILTDNRIGSYEAVSHLISLGHNRIGIVGCSPEYITGRERLEGYLKALKKHHITPSESLIVKSTVRNIEQGYAAALQILDKEEKPTAIFGASYYTTLGILKALNQMNLTIPKDISVIGFDDPEWSECFNPPLTTVAQPAWNMGKIAANTLIDRIEKKKVGSFDTIRLNPNLKIRSSCMNFNP